MRLEPCQDTIAAVSSEAVRESARALLGSDRSVVVIVSDYPNVEDQSRGYGNIVFLDVDGRKLDAPPGRIE
jgi:hypothetical protein